MNKKDALHFLMLSIHELEDEIDLIRDQRKAIRSAKCSVEIALADFEQSLNEGNSFWYDVHRQARDIIKGCVAAVSHGDPETVTVFFDNDDDAVLYRLRWEGSLKTPF